MRPARRLRRVPPAGRPVAGRLAAVTAGWSPYVRLLRNLAARRHRRAHPL